MMDETVQPGQTSEARMDVRFSDTAQALQLSGADRYPPVFATSRMVALMEIAAARMLNRLLQPGQLSVGVNVDIRHTAATPVGATVRARATYLGEEGKLHRFRVEAFDDAGPIGEGEHTRAIVSTERLMAGAEKRKD